MWYRENNNNNRKNIYYVPDTVLMGGQMSKLINENMDKWVNQWTEDCL